MDKDFLEKIAGRWKTPFYLFRTDSAKDQIRKVRDAVGDSVEICYAMKANPFLVADLAETADCFEVCSPGEFRICERAGVPMEKIVLSGVYKEERDIDRIVSRYGDKLTYTAESPLQWQILRNCAQHSGVRIRVLLRLTAGSQFGMDAEDIRKIVSERAEEEYLQIEGIQLFSGTQKKAPGKFRREFAKLSGLLSELGRDYGFVPEKLEYGPGLPVRYFEEEEDAGERMLEALADQLGKFDFEGRIVLEMGRFLAAECGVYVTEIEDLKSNQGQRYCIADGGIHHVSYYGQMMAMKKPPVFQWRKGSGILPRPADGTASEEWTICGSLCTTGDVLVKNYPLRDLKCGDRLIFGRTGAYSVTEGLSLFLSRDLPQVIVCSGKDDFRVARENFRTDSLNWFAD